MGNDIEKIAITPNTQIVFTLKTFIGTIITILGLIIGFHQLIIIPLIDDQKDQLKTMSGKFDKLDDRLLEMSNGIGAINGNIEGINNRFKDLKAVKSTEGGSFGN